MAQYEIRLLKQEEYETWNRFVDNSPQGTLFHKTYWLEASGRKFSLYGCFDDDRLVGGIPATYRRKYGLRVVDHPSLTPYMGILLERRNSSKYVTRLSAEKKIIGALAKQITEDFDVVTFSMSPSFIDLQPLSWANFDNGVRYTYILALNDLDDVWKGMDAVRRRNIRRAEKDGLSADDNGTFEELFALVEKTFQRQAQDLAFKSLAWRYHEVLSHREHCKPFLARNKRGDAIGAVYIVWDNKRSYYLLGGYDPEKSHHGATALAVWEAIKFTKEKLELNEFDFEGSQVPQIERFFRKFGGKLTPCYTVTWAKPHLRGALYVRREIRKVLSRLSGQS